jgi:hypothetical protein
MRQVLLAILGYIILQLLVPQLWSWFMTEVPPRVAQATIFVAALVCVAFVTFADPVYERLSHPAIYRLSSTAIIVALLATVAGTAWWQFAVSNPTKSSSVAEATLSRETVTKAEGPPGSPQPERILVPVAAASMPQGQIAWNFGQFLGMHSGTFDKNAPVPQFRITTFQAFGRNVWSSRIDKITGYVEIDKTKERFPLLYNKDGHAVDLIQMPAIGSDEKTEVLCYFTHPREDYGSWQGIEPDAFLEEFTPFTFVFSINGGAETRLPFSTEECRAQIQIFMDYVNHSKQ